MTKTVLVVDDDLTVREAVRLAFERHDTFRVCEAVDGQDAIEKARKLKPDLIVLDFSMPRMNGIDAARILTQEMRSVPLILLTMHSQEVIGPSAREAGFRAILSKGHDMESLVTLGEALTETSLLK